MSTNILVSYDGTPNDDDALALGKALSGDHSKLALAYVRHTREFDPRREELAEHDAQRRLRTGQDLLGDPSLSSHVVFSASTNDGLEQLAREEGSSMIVFGSDYRTSPGRAEPGNTAQRLLDGGPIAIAVASAGLRLRLGEAIRKIAISSFTADEFAEQTATSLCEQLGAERVSSPQDADLLVVSSQAGAPAGRIVLSGATRSELGAARSSVLVLPAGTAVLL